MSLSHTSAVVAVERAVKALRAGQPVAVADDEGRENEVDLILAAEYANADNVAFFLQYTSGFLCTAITAERAEQLSMTPMVSHNSDPHGTAFLVSVDYAAGCTTGISAADRAATARALADPAALPDHFRRPGHMMPLQARRGGVLRRGGHTEAAVDLCALARLRGAGLLCELVTPDRREMMRGSMAVEFAREHDLPYLTIAELVLYRRRREQLVVRSGEADIPTSLADFRAYCYRTADNVEHFAMVLGDIGAGENVITRVHSECLTGDLFDSQRCDCGAQLRAATEQIVAAGRGIVVYLRGHEGRGIGLGHKLRAYELQQRCGLDTVDANLALGFPADSRDYGVGAHILTDLGVKTVRLLTNNPAKYHGLSNYDLRIVERLPLHITPGPHNVHYIHTKRDRLNHLDADKAIKPCAPPG
jgi:3,4-dihydroxy 2-butanone 4-phosphate synthase / GTP cyclohydrolase II